MSPSCLVSHYVSSYICHFSSLCVHRIHIGDSVFRQFTFMIFPATSQSRWNIYFGSFWLHFGLVWKVKTIQGQLEWQYRYFFRSPLIYPANTPVVLSAPEDMILLFHTPSNTAVLQSLYRTSKLLLDFWKIAFLASSQIPSADYWRYPCDFSHKHHPKFCPQRLSLAHSILPHA